MLVVVGAAVVLFRLPLEQAVRVEVAQGQVARLCLPLELQILVAVAVAAVTKVVGTQALLAVQVS